MPELISMAMDGFDREPTLGLKKHLKEDDDYGNGDQQ